MAWWGWIVTGVALLAAETAVAADFYLAVLGVSALVVGLIGFAGPSLPMWLQWLLFGAFSAVLLLVVRRVVPRVADTSRDQNQAIIGEVAVVQERIDPGGLGRAELRGTAWTARNVSGAPLAAGSRVRVRRIDGLMLDVEPEV